MGRGRSSATAATYDGRYSQYRTESVVREYGNGMRSFDLQPKAIYEAAKGADIEASMAVYQEAGKVARYYGYDDNRSMTDEAGTFRQIQNSIADGNFAEAQRLIDRETAELRSQGQYPEQMFRNIKARRK